MHKVQYPAHGWLPRGAKFVWQRSDQGRDYITNWNGIIQAPGDGVCVTVGSDRPFPSGFGPNYPQVRITGGAWAGHTFYIGHCSSLVRPGEHFGFGHPLARANQGNPHTIGINVDGGWVEFGQVQPNGTLGPASSTGHWFDGLLRSPLVIKVADKPLVFGNFGWRVYGITAQLRDCGWLNRPYFHFNRDVHGAVVAFKLFHHIPSKGPDRGVVDDRTAAAIAHSSDWCKKSHRTEHG